VAQTAPPPMAPRSPPLLIRERLQVSHVPTKGSVIGEDLWFGRGAPLMGGSRSSWKLTQMRPEATSLLEARAPEEALLRSHFSVETPFAGVFTNTPSPTIFRSGAYSAPVLPAPNRLRRRAGDG
jgi:hypothetical protein